jgi:hypothetical protein
MIDGMAKEALICLASVTKWESKKRDYAGIGDSFCEVR